MSEPYIRIVPHDGRVTVRLAGEIVAKSDAALDLHEGTYDPVIYVPRTDCRMDHFEATDRTTHCPHKGDARYWTLRAGGTMVENGAWAYDETITGKTGADVGAIAGHVAFYPGKVEIES